MKIKNFLLACVIALSPFNAWSLTFPLPKAGDSVVGVIQKVKSEPGETLAQVGQRFDIGYYEMVEANPDVHLGGVLPPWTRLVIPSRYVLPKAPRVGIVINLAELRLYYYPPGKNQVITMPVGIGREGWETPLGTTKIVAKAKNPAWYPTDSVRADAAATGIFLPKVIKPGPDNPLGKFAMRLAWDSYLIHGTNNPIGVGRRSSAGCIRMFPVDILKLFGQSKIGTPVRVINNPFKIGWLGTKLYFEAHTPLDEQSVRSTLIDMLKTVLDGPRVRNVHINWGKADRVSQRQSGIPQVIAEILPKLSKAPKIHFFSID